MSSLSRDEAQSVLEDIRSKKGYLPPEERAITKAIVLRALDSVRLQLGKATRALAQNLFSSDARFVYELIQNAEDNRYHDGTLNYLSFTILQDSLVVESNEIGFDVEDVKAICSTGDSTKFAQHGYIGQKGIGFKSVFKVAKKAKIQSGPFSFALEHTPESDASGLGLITPLPQTYDDLPCGVGTRMTLSLTAKATRESTYLADLLQVPDTILLFLGKLNEIRIINDTKCQERIVTSYTFQKGEAGARTCLRKTITTPLGTTTSATHIYMFEREVEDLALHDTRPGTTGRVAVAFPVSADDTPITARQHVSAYLPLNDVGFKFLIQGDFVTQASREGIVACDRNEQLLDGVAHAFKEAIQWFALHQKLTYTWVRWLPKPEEITNEFWRRLVDKIVSLLQRSKILYSWSDGALFRPDALHYLEDAHRDSAGEPLFKDLPCSQGYLSQHYDLASVLVLKTLGVSVASYTLLLNRLEADLEKNDSIYKATTTDDDWHTRVATLTLDALECASPSLSNRVRALEMIPVASGWPPYVAATDGPLSFPRVGQSDIPLDIGLKLVSSSAEKLPARWRLFRALGVSICTVQDVVQMIYDKYVGVSPRHWHLWNVCSHILFLFENPVAAGPKIKTKIFLGAERVWLRGNRFTDRRLYFNDRAEPYGVYQLLSNGDPQTTHGISAKGVYFLHPGYLDDHKVGSGRAQVLKEWLAETFDIETTIRLLHHSRPGLSEEYLFIREHRPHRLLGLLQKNWSSYLPVIDQVSAELKSTLVALDAASPLSVRLEDGYLPLPRLKSIVQKARVSNTALFLRIPEVVRDEDVVNWEFLATLGVGTDDDVRFYLAILQQQAQLSPPPAVEEIRHIYDRLAATCSREQDRQQIIDCFSKIRLVYSPGPMECAAPGWAHLRDCVWRGPDWLTSKTTLVTIWPSLELLFRAVLKVGDFVWRDCLAELESIKSSGSYNTTTIVRVYQWLERDFRHLESCRELREELNERELIFVPHENRWTSVSLCLWTPDTIQVPNQRSIATSYACLEHFFTNMLRVQRPDLSMHVQAFQQLARLPGKLDDWEKRFKESIRLVNSFNPEARDLKPLLGANIFPVRLPSGEVRPTSSRVEFAIVDREEYDGIFKNCNILAFSLPEVNSLRPFLLAMELKAKHMSELVQERTTASDSVVSRALTQSIQSRAYAMLRCAVAFRSPKTAQANQALFRQLQHTEVFLSDNIWKTSTLTQNGTDHVAKQQRATMHLDQAEGRLRIHIPRDEDVRELCYFTTLPSRLRRFLEIADPSAERILVGILRCTRLANVDEVLKSAGIAEVEGVSRPDEPLTGVQTDTSSPEREGPQSSERPTPAPDPLSISSNDGSSNGAAEDSTHGRDSHASQSRVWEEHTLPPVNQQGYMRLLECLIQDASLDLASPLAQVGEFSSQLRRESAPSFARLFSERSFPRDRKVGAAGELFVFEFLMAIGLPGFTTTNWQSTIRHEANCCDKYSRLSRWDGRETSDIVYEDRDGTFITFLVQHGHVPAEYTHRRLNFFIEVKTTTGGHDEPFYVSSNQYQRMESLRRPLQRALTDAYLVMRVFNLTGRKLGLRIFFDPFTAKDEGKLRFSMSGDWTVRPTSAV